MGRKTTGLVFDFVPGIHVVSEEAGLFSFKVPDFVQALEGVALVNGFLDFGCAPGIGQLTLLGCVVTDPSFVVQRFVDVGFSTGPTEGKH